MNPKNKLAEMPVRPLLYTMAVPLMLSLTAGHKKTISAAAEATALIVNGLTSGVGESYSLAGWKWS